MKTGGVVEVITIENKTTGARCTAAPGFRLAREDAYMIKDRDLHNYAMKNYQLGHQSGYKSGLIVGTVIGIGACLIFVFRKPRKAKKHHKEIREEE